MVTRVEEGLKNDIFAVTSFLNDLLTLITYLKLDNIDNARFFKNSCCKINCLEYNDKLLFPQFVIFYKISISIQAINFIHTNSLSLIHIYEARAAASETSM